MSRTQCRPNPSVVFISTDGAPTHETEPIHFTESPLPFRNPHHHLLNDKDRMLFHCPGLSRVDDMEIEITE